MNNNVLEDYSTNYLNEQCIMYPTHTKNRKYVKGFYMFKEEYKRELVEELGDSGYILFDYFSSRSNYKYFMPTDDIGIGKKIGWSTSKVTRIKSVLVKKKYLKILKDTVRDGRVMYTVLLGKEIVSHYYSTFKILDEDVTTVDISNNANEVESTTTLVMKSNIKESGDNDCKHHFSLNPETQKMQCIQCGKLQ